MTTTMRFATMMALMTGLVTMVHAALLVAAEPPQAAAPADLRELAGQAVPNERNLQWKHAEVMIEWGFTEGHGEAGLRWQPGMHPDRHGRPGPTAARRRSDDRDRGADLEIARRDPRPAGRRRAGALHALGPRPEPHDPHGADLLRQLFLPTRGSGERPGPGDGIRLLRAGHDTAPAAAPGAVRAGARQGRPSLDACRSARNEDECGRRRRGTLRLGQHARRRASMPTPPRNRPCCWAASSSCRRGAWPSTPGPTAMWPSAGEAPRPAR